MINHRKIVLKKNTVIYIMSPSNTFTGGPELLHQLAFYISKILKIDTKMFYLPEDESNPIHSNFKKYNINYSKKIEDLEENILIIPEHYLFLKYSEKFKKIKKILWWLSLDNYYGYKFRYDYNKYIRSIIKIPYNFIKLFNISTNFKYGILNIQDYLKFIYKFKNIKNQTEIKQIDQHLAQSRYAYDYLKKYFKNILFLSDFQRSEVLKKSKIKVYKKKNLVCYSSKSNEFIQKIKETTNFDMIELAGMNTNEIINTFKKTKVYLDFGYHPGKDRMPREAALFNNCIITNKKGSALNNYDIPINSKYKFNESNSNLNKIKIQIEKFFKDYNTEVKKFKRYKKIILKEELKFKRDLKKIFHKSL